MICSFPKCREDGVKFLYCLYCRDAIGKRVFRNQHHHLDDTGQAPVPSTGTGTPAAHGQIGQLDTAGMIPTGLPVLSAVTGAVTGGAVTGTRVSVQKSSQADQSQMIPCRARGIPDHDFKVSEVQFCLISPQREWRVLKNATYHQFLTMHCSNFAESLFHYHTRH